MKFHDLLYSTSEIMSNSGFCLVSLVRLVIPSLVQNCFNYFNIKSNSIYGSIIRAYNLERRIPEKTGVSSL